jgi:hypothetical protein
MEDARSFGRGFQACEQQCAHAHYRATLRYLLATILGVWLEQLVSTTPEAFRYNEHRILLCPSDGDIKNWS